jgi:hypothetical protein
MPRENARQKAARLLVQKGEGTRASTWKLRTPPRTQLEPSPVLEETEPEGSRCVLSGDVWRWRALGKRKAQTYSMLGSDPTTTVAIAVKLGVQERTARRHLHDLAAVGLADRHPEGWVRGGADPGQVAEAFGVSGIGERQRGRHHQHTQMRRLRTLPERKESQPSVIAAAVALLGSADQDVVVVSR